MSCIFLLISGPGPWSLDSSLLSGEEGKRGSLVEATARRPPLTGGVRRRQRKSLGLTLAASSVAKRPRCPRERRAAQFKRATTVALSVSGRRCVLRRRAEARRSRD